MFSRLLVPWRQPTSRSGEPIRKARSKKLYLEALDERIVPTVDPTPIANANNTGSAYHVGEGLSLTLSGSGTDDNPLPAAAADYQWDFNYNGVTFVPTAGAIGTAPSFSAAAIDGPATRTVALRIRDSLTAEFGLPATAVVTIDNLAPVATLTATSGVQVTGVGAGTTVTGNPVSFSLSATDFPADLAANATFQINWDFVGNPANFETAPGSTPMNTPQTFNHIYTTSGNFQVAAKVTDKDGTPSTIQIFNLSVKNYALIGNNLVVGGTNSPDVINITKSSTGVVVRLFGSPSFSNPVSQSFNVTNGGHILIRGLGAADIICVQAAVDVPCEIYGGEGNDLITGGKGNDSLFGEAGKDIIYGSNGNDLMFGGLGVDLLFGGDGHDVLVAGNTTLATSAVPVVAGGVLDQLLTNWVATRSTTLSASFTSAYSDTDSADCLAGGNGDDWFIQGALDKNSLTTIELGDKKTTL